MTTFWYYDQDIKLLKRWYKKYGNLSIICEDERVACLIHEELKKKAINHTIKTYWII